MQLLQVPTTKSSTSIRELNRNKVIIFACCWPDIWPTSRRKLLGRAWASPTVMWLTEASAMHYGAYVHGTFLHWLKSHRHATGTSTSLLLTRQLCFQVHNFSVNLHGFAFRKTLHISQDVICWQSWSNNNSKYGLVRRTYTIYYGRSRFFFVWVGQFAFDNSCSYTAIAKCWSLEVFFAKLVKHL